jgi:ADP-L-glycero-D-manno-heptose 6-epimerase
MAIIVVTGGAGFIGSNLLRGLEHDGGYDLVCCDRFGDGEKWRNIAKRALYDIVAPEQLAAWLATRSLGEVAAILHMGAISDTTARDVDRVVEQNFRFSLELWKWCARNGTRFIYASSAATYGDGGAGFDDFSDEKSLAKLAPLNPYGWSKHAFDRRVASDRGGGQPMPPQHVGLKFFNVYGPNEYHKGPQRSVVHQIFPFARRGKAFPLFKSHRAGIEDGGQKRDFVWVGDCVDVVRWLLANPQISGLFNVGSGRARSFLDLARATFRACERKPAIAFRAMPKELRDRYQYFTEAKLERLRAAGYTKPMTELEDGVTRYVREFLARDDPYA